MSMYADEIDVAALRAVEALGFAAQSETAELPASAWRGFAGAEGNALHAGPRWDRLLQARPSAGLTREPSPAAEGESRSAPVFHAPEQPQRATAAQPVSELEPSLFLAAPPAGAPIWQELALDDESALSVPLDLAAYLPAPAASIADEIDLG
jgi:hypothetical protein